MATSPGTAKLSLQTMAMPSLTVPSRKRSRCISCSDSLVGSSFEDNSPYLVPELISRRTRTGSICERIHEEPQTGRVKYFCRSRGHGFIIPNQDNNKSRNASTEANNKVGDADIQNQRKTSESSDNEDIFMHISDIDSEFVPRAGDKVSYRVCPIPPKFEKIQAVNVHILELADSGIPKRWDNPETPEELAEDNNLDNHPPIYDV